ncbi:unnamed protein product, partial [Mesorhabditis spiculigera]
MAFREKILDELHPEVLNLRVVPAQTVHNSTGVLVYDLYYSKEELTDLWNRPSQSEPVTIYASVKKMTMSYRKNRAALMNKWAEPKEKYCELTPDECTIYSYIVDQLRSDELNVVTWIWRESLPLGFIHQKYITRRPVTPEEKAQILKQCHRDAYYPVVTQEYRRRRDSRHACKGNRFHVIPEGGLEGIAPYLGPSRLPVGAKFITADLKIRRNIRARPTNAPPLLIRRLIIEDFEEFLSEGFLCGRFFSGNQFMVTPVGKGRRRACGCTLDLCDTWEIAVDEKTEEYIEFRRPDGNEEADVLQLVRPTEKQILQPVLRNLPIKEEEEEFDVFEIGAEGVVLCTATQDEVEIMTTLIDKNLDGIAWLKRNLLAVLCPEFLDFRKLPLEVTHNAIGVIIADLHRHKGDLADIWNRDAEPDVEIEFEELMQQIKADRVDRFHLAAWSWRETLPLGHFDQAHLMWSPNVSKNRGGSENNRKRKSTHVCHGKMFQALPEEGLEDSAPYLGPSVLPEGAKFYWADKNLREDVRARSADSAPLLIRRLVLKGQEKMISEAFLYGRHGDGNQFTVVSVGKRSKSCCGCPWDKCDTWEIAVDEKTGEYVEFYPRDDEDDEDDDFLNSLEEEEIVSNRERKPARPAPLTESDVETDSDSDSNSIDDVIFIPTTEKRAKPPTPIAESDVESDSDDDVFYDAIDDEIQIKRIRL